MINIVIPLTLTHHCGRNHTFWPIFRQQCRSSENLDGLPRNKSLPGICRVYNSLAIHLAIVKNQHYSFDFRQFSRPREIASVDQQDDGQRLSISAQGISRKFPGRCIKRDFDPLGSSWVMRPQRCQKTSQISWLGGRSSFGMSPYRLETKDVFTSISKKVESA